MAEQTRKVRYKIVVYDDAVNSGGTVEVLGPDDKPIAGRDLKEGIDGVVHIEPFELLTTRDLKGAMRVCCHVRCRLYCF